MKIYAKFLCLALTALMILPALAGCHGSRESVAFAIPDEFDTSREYEITFWAKNDNNATQREIYKKAVEDFEAIYPNIKVKLVSYSNYGDIYNKVITNLATGTTPNVCITYPDHIATYIEGSNTVVPLDDLIKDKKYGLGGSEVKFDSPDADELIDKFLKEGQIASIQYALPFLRSTEICYVNKTYVEKLGYTLPEKLTWDFIWEVSEAATAMDANGNYVVNGQKTMIPFIYKSTDNMMIQMLRQLGAGYSTNGGRVEIFNDTTKQILLEVASHAKTKAFSTFKISSYPANFLNAGQCIFAIDSSAGATWMGSEAPMADIHDSKKVSFETAVMELPQFDTENPTMISQGPSMCIFNKEDPQEVLASWLFMQFLLTDDVQISYSQTEGYIPVTTKAQSSERYLDYLSRAGEDNDLYYDIKLQATRITLDNVDNTFVTPVFNGSASLRDAAGQMIEEVTKGVRRGKTVDDDFIETLYSDMSSLYRLDRINGIDGKAEFDRLPDTAVMLLSAIGAAWVFIIIYFVADTIKKRKNCK